MGIADLVANVNFFSKIAVDDEGHMAIAEDHCPAGARIGLRTEMDVLFVLELPPSACAAGEYPPARVEIEIFLRPAGKRRFRRTFRPECGRTLALTERLFL
jgi:uncharacterized protein YcgI (DUF1989 family)